MPALSRSRVFETALPSGVPWRWAVFVLVLCLSVILFSFAGTLQAMIKVWLSSSTYGHGPFIIPIALFLIWWKRDDLVHIKPRPSVTGLALVIAACFGWLIGMAANTMLVAQLSLILIIQGCTVTLLGWRVAGSLLFALLYLYMAIPAGDFLLPYLQDLAAWLVQSGLRLFGVPVHLDGVLIIVPGGQFKIAEACAGLRFMLPILALSLVYAYLIIGDFLRGALFIAFSVFVTLMANALRAMGSVLFAYWFDRGAAVSFDHLTYGWLFLTSITLLLFLCGFFFRKRSRWRGPRRAEYFQRVENSPFRLLMLGLAIIALASTSAAHARSFFNNTSPHSGRALEVPARLGEWQVTAPSRSNWRPEFIQPDSQLHATLESNGEVVDLHVAFYAPPRPGAELINEANSRALLAGWARLGIEPVEIRFDGEILEARALTLVNQAGHKRLTIQWYWIGGHATGNRAIAKARQAFQTLFGLRRDSASIALSLPAENMTKAIESLRAIAASLPSIDQMLTPSPGDPEDG